MADSGQSEQNFSHLVLVLSAAVLVLVIGFQLLARGVRGQDRRSAGTQQDTDVAQLLIPTERYGAAARGGDAAGVRASAGR